MKARKYDKAQDFESIKSWGKQWGADYDSDLFPPDGYIVPGYAAYFIYYTNSKAVWLENMVCNKEVTPEERDIALQLVVTEVLREINSKGIKIAYATTDNTSVIGRAIQHGSTALEGQTLLKLRFKTQSH